MPKANEAFQKRMRDSGGRSPKCIQAESRPNARPQATQKGRSVRIAQTFLDFGHEIVAEFDIVLSHSTKDK